MNPPNPHIFPSLWFEEALQGLPFWIGHRHALFREYPLSEGALVAELCNLISAKLPSHYTLFPECMYRNLLPKQTSLCSVPDAARADLVICDKPVGAKIRRDGDLSNHVRFIFEVKRGSAPKSLIESDLKRLSKAVKSVNSPRFRAFLIIVYEKNPNEKFIKNGKAVKGLIGIDDFSGKFRVRRVLKAASSFVKYESSFYLCLVEAV